MSGAKAGPGAGVERINLKVKGQDGVEVSFRVKRSSRLKKMMDAYCQQKSPDGTKPFVFLFDGRKIRGEDTPDKLGLEDEDIIAAMIPQTGG